MSGETIIWIVAIICATIIIVSNNLRRSSYGNRHRNHHDLRDRVEELEREVHTLQDRVNDHH